jgi:macrodomain Ter protein organizer (MatP/YcbG family)
MPRPRYQLTEADVPVVHRWVQAKRHDPTWPQPEAARTARDQFARTQPIVEALQAWCARFLEAPQWRQLQAVIRAARRDASQTRTVRLSTGAYARLHGLATREQLTLSETIERYLTAATPTPTHQETPTETLQTPVTITTAKTGARAKARTTSQKQGSAFVTTKKGGCYLTIKSGRMSFQIMRIRQYTIDTDEKRRMRRLHPDIHFDWKKITRQLAEKRRRYRARRRTPRVPRYRAREPFYGGFQEQSWLNVR